MFKHFIKIAWRSLAKQKMLAFINVFGLSVGIACFTLVLLFTVNEFSFDTFHERANEIYRVYEWVKPRNGGSEQAGINLPLPLAPALKKDFPDVISAVRVRGDFGTSLLRFNEHIHRVKVTYADPEFFSVFSFPLLHGNTATALNDMHSIVVTEAKAEELFGTVDVVGRTVQLKVDEKFTPFTITAVAQNVPTNSSLKFDVVGNFKFIEGTEEGKGAADNWFRSMYQTFVLLQPGSTLPNNTSKLIAFRSNYYPGEEEEMKKNGIEWEGEGPPITYGLQPLTNMHLDEKIQDPNRVEKKTLYILLCIAAGVLLIACINFTTLAIGRSAGRSKEVGVRKVIGAARKQLVFQFLSEALLLTIIATVLGLLLANLLLPFFNRLSARDLSFSFYQYPQLWWLLLGLMLVVGLLTGSYPALVLSAFKPIEVLKSKVRIGGANLFTKSLVTFQFALSTVLIISTVIILQQTKHMSSKHPGFDKENVVLVNAADTDTKKIYPLFKQALSAQSEISGVASAAIGLGEGEDFWVTGFKYKDKPVYACFNPVDADYLDVLGMELLAGRNFNANIASDTINSVIVNEELLKQFGWTIQNAVGQTLDGFSPDKTPVVIGVVKNFNFAHAGEEIRPQMFAPFFEKVKPKFYVRIKPGDPGRALAHIQKTWSSIVADVPMQYNFLDEKLDAYYKTEKRWSSIVGWAGGISIVLACLGLFGLAALVTINRVKEIGIRKVLGATVTNIVTLVSKDFLQLIIIAVIIASPVAWYFMSKWLQTFVYRINITWVVFIAAGVFAFLIAFTTICFQAIKAAMANPVKSLRSE